MDEADPHAHIKDLALENAAKDEATRVVGLTDDEAVEAPADEAPKDEAGSDDSAPDSTPEPTE